MFDWNWIETTGTTVLMVGVSAVSIYAVLLVLTRLSGLRSFSKMSSFDFAITVAFGSVLASTILAPEPSVLTGAAALAAFYGLQYAVSKSRRVSRLAESLVDNQPLLLIAEGKILSEHLDEARMTVDDLRSKLRMAGVANPRQVTAAVFESTGDVSILLAGDAPAAWLFKGIRGAEHLSFMGPQASDDGGPL